MQSYYDVLKVSKNATKEEIKSSYKKLAKIYHPDKNNEKDAKEHFQKIQEAYEHLSDDEKKAQYDNPMPQNPFNFMNQNNMPGFPFNIFQQHFNQQNNKKNDEIFICNITLSDVYFGTVKHFNIKKKYMCESCKIQCKNCNGSGVINGQKIQMGPFVQFLQQQCNVCSGNCVIRNNITCNNCNSSGFLNKEKNIEIHIPKGVENNKQYIYEGWGEQAVKSNEKSGDFIIRLNVENHDTFERENLNLIYKTQITLYESIIGKELTIPYFEDKIIVNVNTFGIINPEKEYIVLEKGLRNEMNQKGNLKIIFKIIYPEKTFNNDEIKDISKIFKKLNLI